MGKRNKQTKKQRRQQLPVAPSKDFKAAIQAVLDTASQEEVTQETAIIEKARPVKRVVAPAEQPAPSLPQTGDGIQIGYVVEHNVDRGKLLWSKILTTNPDTGEWINILAYRPAQEYTPWSTVKVELKPYFERWSANITEVISETSQFTQVMQEIQDLPVVHEMLPSSLFPSQIAVRIMDKIVPNKKLPQLLGFKEVKGRYAGGSMIVFN